MVPVSKTRCKLCVAHLGRAKAASSYQGHENCEFGTDEHLSSCAKCKNALKPRQCSMCVIHLGDDAPLFKGHKECIYREKKHLKDCGACQKVENRRTGVRVEKKACYVSQKSGGNAQLSSLQPGEKACRKCRNHGKEVPVRNGHKFVCAYADCSCEICEPTNVRRKHGTEFTKLHRTLKGRFCKSQKIYTVFSSNAFQTRDLMESEDSKDSSENVIEQNEENMFYSHVEALNCTEEEALKEFGPVAVGANVEIVNDFCTDTDYEVVESQKNDDDFNDFDDNNNFDPNKCLNFNDITVQKSWESLTANETSEDNLHELADFITSDEIKFIVKYLLQIFSETNFCNFSGK